MEQSVNLGYWHLSSWIVLRSMWENLLRYVALCLSYTQGTLSEEHSSCSQLVKVRTSPLLPYQLVIWGLCSLSSSSIKWERWCLELWCRWNEPVHLEHWEQHLAAPKPVPCSSEATSHMRLLSIWKVAGPRWDVLLSIKYTLDFRNL